jgi:nucleoid DNA-binding protein
MNQAQFLNAFDDYTILPRKTRREILLYFKHLVAQKLLISEPVILPQLGKIFVQYQPPRTRHNIRLDTTTVYPAKYKIKMSRYGYQQQALYDKYNINVDYLGYKNYPSQSIAKELADLSEYDLLSCQDFMRNFVQIIIDAAKIDEKVMLYGIGSFKPIEIQVERPDPISPIGFYTGIASSNDGAKWCAIPMFMAGFTPLNSADGITWEASPAISETYYAAVAWSEALALFCAVGYVEVLGVPKFHTITSADGIAWSETVESFSFTCLCVYYAEAAGIWLSGGFFESVSSLLQSSDAISWSFVTAVPIVGIAGFAYSPTLALYVAVGFPNGICDKVYSVDAITWIASANYFAAEYAGVAWSESLEIFSATANKSGVGYHSYSLDGINWTNVNLGTVAFISAPAAGSGKVKFVFATYKDGSTRIWNSKNGLTYTQRQVIAGFLPLVITYNAELNQWAITGQDYAGDALLISKNGTVFYQSRTAADPPPAIEYRKVITYRPSAKLEESIN